jgi:hypothetical protein
MEHIFNSTENTMRIDWSNCFLKEEDFYEEGDETVCITKKEYDELLEYKYMYEKLCD